jgi:transcriptional regulator with PAS, ATPase and Fis domain
MKNELFEQLMHNKHEAFLFLDSFGKVIYFNQIFATWFKVSLDESKNINCLEIIPELDRALTCLETGHRIMFEEIFLRKAPEQKQFLRMDVTPIKQDDLITGLSIKLSDSGNVRQTVNKIANSQAYYTFENIIGESSAIRQVKERAVNIAKSRSSVIITGESGTGKELFAQAIHNKSIRRDNPFVALNCAAIPSELIASELFGHVEGAFTGARKGGSMGKFEYAHQGTLFLDEIGELPMYAQTMLLRVLEERTVTRIGSNITTPVDVRLICATNRDLRKMVNEGAFRLDLYYRINVIHLHLPPLRDRVTDIPLMLDYFIDYFNEVLDKNVQQVSPKALSYLVRCAWPGNLREFRNAVECAVNNVEGTTLKLEDLPGDIFDQLDSDEVGKAKQFTNSETDFWKEERKKILSTLIKYNGNKSQVAEELNVSRSTLYKKIREYKLD